VHHVVRDDRTSAGPRGFQAAVEVLLIDDEVPERVCVTNRVERPDDELCVHVDHAARGFVLRRASKPETANGPAPVIVSVARQAR
jgi:hypothetical protein